MPKAELQRACQTGARFCRFCIAEVGTFHYVTCSSKDKVWNRLRVPSFSSNVLRLLGAVVPGFVYVVDDDAAFRAAIERRLKMAGYEVASYPSAETFSRKLARRK